MDISELTKILGRSPSIFCLSINFDHLNIRAGLFSVRLDHLNILEHFNIRAGLFSIGLDHLGIGVERLSVRETRVYCT